MRRPWNVKRAMNICNGQLRAAMAGSWMGSVPYGYKIEGKKHHKQLVLDNSLQVETVRRIYTLYDSGMPAAEIARLLNSEGVPAPRDAKYWRDETITRLLRRPVYVGDYRFNFHSEGKYYCLQDGKPAARTGHWLDEDCERASVQRNPAADWIYHRDRWPAIVDRLLWDRVQQRLDRNQQSKPPVDKFLFSSLLQCGAWDQTMWGITRKGIERYVCPKCQAAVSQAQVLRETASAIQRSASPEQIAKYKQALHRSLLHSSDGKQINTAAIEKEIQRQERKLVVLDADCIKPVQDEIHRLRTELEQAQRTKQQARVLVDIQQRIDQGVQDFYRLPEVLAGKDTQRVRNYLQRTIGGIRLMITTVQQGKRRQYRLLQGKIYQQFPGTGQPQYLERLRPDSMKRP